MNATAIVGRLEETSPKTKAGLIATIKYRWRMVYIRRILSHADYDEKEWQT